MYLKLYLLKIHYLIILKLDAKTKKTISNTESSFFFSKLSIIKPLFYSDCFYGKSKRSKLPILIPATIKISANWYNLILS